MVETKISYGILLHSLRKYIEDTTGLPTVWRYVGFKPPSTPDFMTIQFVNSAFNTRTKLRELVDERIFFHISTAATDVVTLDKQQSKLTEILMYHKIPLLDYEGNQHGIFSVTNITAINQIDYGTQVEQETERLRSYTDFYVDVNHIKKRQ